MSVNRIVKCMTILKVIRNIIRGYQYMYIGLYMCMCMRVHMVTPIGGI